MCFSSTSTSTPARASIPRIESRTPGEHGELLVVRYADAAELTRLLVGGGVRIDELRPQHHTLEDTVLALSGPGSDVVSRRPGRRGRRPEPPGAPS